MKLSKIRCGVLIILGLLSLFGTSWATDEQEEIVDRMYDKGMTKYTTLKEFRPYDKITREEASKIIMQYASKNSFFLKNFEKGKTCFFNDSYLFDRTLSQDIFTACEYGVFKGYGGNFHPKKNMKQAEAIAVVIRVKKGPLPEDESVWYQRYFDEARVWGVLTNTSSRGLYDVGSTDISRIDFGTMLYNAYKTRWELNGQFMEPYAHVLAGIEYSWRSEDGKKLIKTNIKDLAQAHNMLDSNESYELLYFSPSDRKLIEGLENGVVGLLIGESRTLKILPEYGFGYKDNSWVIDVPTDFFTKQGISPTIGKRYNVPFENGDRREGQIININKETVSVDFNPPYVGKTIIAKVKLISIQR